MKVAKTCICCGNSNLQKTPAVLMPFVAERVFEWQPMEITPEFGLNTLKTGNAYSVCNTLYCKACGLVFCDMRFDDDEMKRLYAGYRDELYTTLREKYEPGYTQRNQVLLSDHTHTQDVERFLLRYMEKPVSVLDYGGGDGKNAPFGGGVVYDIDTNATAPTTTFDLVVCAHVLEHVSNPADTLLDISRFMRLDSLLYIEVPLEDFMFYRKPYTQKKHWHEHINFFTRESIIKLLDGNGFAIVGLELGRLRDRKVLRLLARK